MKRNVLILVALIVALFSASFLPIANIVQMILRGMVIFLCLISIIYFLRPSCRESAREKGEYFCFYISLLLFVVVLNTMSFFPLSETMVVILRLCAIVLALVGFIVIIVFSRKGNDS
ncbi:MAG: hypothetical protein J6M18_04855 [Actinomycetaceae bacterium]|nr:hypothetical protein [Actinomycetaceae bacterium]